MTPSWQQFLENPTPDAFAHVYEATGADVWTICVRVLGDGEEALDAFQGTWNRLLELASRGETPPTDMRATVRAMAFREAERLRGQRRRRRRREAAVSDLAGMPASDNPRAQAEMRELREKVELLVNLLPDLYRVPLQLHYLHGMSYAEIADTTGRPISTISTQVSRGLDRLRALAKRAGLKESALMAALTAGGAMMAPPSSATAATAFATASAFVSGTSPATILTGVTIMKSKSIVIAAVVLLILITGGVILNRGSEPSSVIASATNTPLPTPTEAPVVETPSPQTTINVDEVASTEPEPELAVAPMVEPTPTPQSAAAEELQPQLAEKQETIVFGTVFDTNGRPASNAEVWMFMTGYSARSDEDGHYEFVVEPSEMTTYMSGAKAVSIMAARDDFRSAPRGGIQLNWNELNGPFDLHLKQQGRLLTVLVTAADEPLPDAVVLLQDGREQRTDENGTARFEALAAGEWQVEAYAPGFARSRKTVSLLAQEDALIEVGLSVGGAVYGVVSDERGNPLEGVSYGYMVSGPMGLLRQKVTGADGYYRIESLPLQGGNVNFTKEGYPTQNLTGLEFTDEVDEIERNVVMGDGGTFEGRVVSAANNAPIAGARVTFEPNRASVVGMTDSNGRFKLTGLRSTENAALLVEAKGFAAKLIQNVKDEYSNNVEYEVRMTPGNWINGRVVDTNGQPVAGVMVAPLLDTQQLGYTYLTDKLTTQSDGRFAFDSLPDDIRFDFVPRPPLADLRLQVLPLNRSDFEVTLRSFLIVRGRVIDSVTKEPVKQFNIRLKGSYEVSRVRRGVDFDTTDGRFMLNELNPDQPVEITVTAEGYEIADVTLDADESESEVLLEPLAAKEN